jgi:uncharacterized protein
MILENQVLPEIDRFASLTFEEVCQQFFWQAGISMKLPFVPTNIGNWWNAHEEIDLIVLGENDAILVECKWVSKPVGIDILEELERKAQLAKAELGDRHIRYALCSRSGFTPQLVEDASRRQVLSLFDLPEIVG